MPTHFPLPPASDKNALANQLNDQELSLGRQVVSVNGVSTGDPADQLNSVTIEFNLDADKMQRLNVELVPNGATQADMDAAGSPDAAQNVKDAFLQFIAPLLDNGEMLCRSEVFLGGKKAEIVLLRAVTATTPQPAPGAKILKGGAGWGWDALVVGDDIVVQGAKTTAFGGDSDKSDSGETACGFPTKGHPDLMGCALPLAGYAKSPAAHAALDGTPLPHMPFGLTSKGADNPTGAHVEVTDPATGKKTIVPVIDLGPAKGTGHALDLTVAAARLFKPNATANNFAMKLNYRIIDGAKFVT
jgi:hypothetical protein